MDRFSVEQTPTKVFWVKDNLTGQSQEFQGPKMAVSIYFKSKDRPERIANMMNAEWQEFLRNNP